MGNRVKIASHLIRTCDREGAERRLFHIREPTGIVEFYDELQRRLIDGMYANKLPGIRMEQKLLSQPQLNHNLTQPNITKDGFDMKITLYTTHQKLTQF